MTAPRPQDGALPRERVQEAAAGLRDSDEFRHLFREQRQLDLDLDWLPDWSGTFVGYLFWGILIIAGVALLLWVLSLLGVLGRRGGDGEESAPEARRRHVAEALAAAVAARAAGDLRLALRHYWSALVTGLGRGEALAWRPAWTCREMLARSRPGSTSYALLAERLPRVERLEFGRAPIVEADVDDLARLCDEHLTAALRREESDA